MTKFIILVNIVVDLNSHNKNNLGGFCMNEVLLLVEMLFVFSALLLFFKLFGKYGVFAWVGMIGILAEIFVSKQFDFFGLQITGGNVEFASLFLATDILSECYSGKESKKAVNIMMVSVLFFVIISQIVIRFNPNDLDYVNDSMSLIFTQSPRICLSSLFMLFISNRFDVWLFNKFKRKFGDRMLWLRNNVSTIICNCLENYFFMFLAFYKNPVTSMSIQEIFIVGSITSLVESLIAICDTPFLYFARKIFKNNKINELC